MWSSPAVILRSFRDGHPDASVDRPIKEVVWSSWQG